MFLMGKSPLFADGNSETVGLDIVLALAGGAKPVGVLGWTADDERGEGEIAFRTLHPYRDHEKARAGMMWFAEELSSRCERSRPDPTWRFRVVESPC